MIYVHYDDRLEQQILLLSSPSEKKRMSHIIQAVHPGPYDYHTSVH